MAQRRVERDQVAICGPKSDEEMKESITLLDRGPLDDDEMQRMRRIGEHVHGIRSTMAALVG